MGIFKNAARRVLKMPLILIGAFLILGMGAVAYRVLANPDAIVTPAIGGEAVSIDSTSNGGTGAWTNLDGPKITEGTAGDIALGSHTITLPDGWEFNTMKTVSIGIESGGASGFDLHTYIVAPTSKTLSFYVDSASISSPESITFDNIQVRPTSQNVGSGNITMTVGEINGVDSSTSFGTLTTLPGIVTKLAFTTQPGSGVYGSLLPQQPVVKTQDQFGNDSANGLEESKIVTLLLIEGTGTLLGTASIDIGTSAGNGVVSFNDIAINTAGTEKQLSVSTVGLIGAESELFNIDTKPLVSRLF